MLHCQSLPQLHSLGVVLFAHIGCGQCRKNQTDFSLDCTTRVWGKHLLRLEEVTCQTKTESACSAYSALATVTVRIQGVVDL